MMHSTARFAILSLLLAVSAMQAQDVERWGVYEVSLNGPSTGNPFTDVTLSARFEKDGRSFTPQGFYDGNGVYKIRFMPDETGAWSYTTTSNKAELSGKSGSFTCVAPLPGNHGPMRVKDTWHFAYADGQHYNQIGTTCYAWTHQGDVLENQTLQTLATAAFNKIRMCVFPKSFTYNNNEPVYHPFEKKADGAWDFSRFNPAFWRHFEGRVQDLMKLGIEADIILFHPYDRWGYKNMGLENNQHYLRYAVARLAAYRNVWWSMANEWDLMGWNEADWDVLGKLVAGSDPYDHLTGIHNAGRFYDHSKAWITHVSIQNFYTTVGNYRDTYHKPIVFDEWQYEGTIPDGWGNLSGEEMTHRFWLGTVGGCYVGHSETYADPKDILWWSKGGILKGQSPQRLALLKEIMEQSPQRGFEPVGSDGACKGEEFYLYYYGKNGQASRTFTVPSNKQYVVDIIDTWNMKVTRQPQTRSGTFTLTLPTGQYTAVRIALPEAIVMVRQAPATTTPAVGTSRNTFAVYGLDGRRLPVAALSHRGHLRTGIGLCQDGRTLRILAR